MQNRAIDLQLVKPISKDSNIGGKITLKNLQKELLTQLNVPFGDFCCQVGSNLPLGAPVRLFEDELQFLGEDGVWTSVDIGGGGAGLRFGVAGQDDTGAENRVFTTNSDFEILASDPLSGAEIHFRTEATDQFADVKLTSSAFIVQVQETLTGVGQFSLSNLVMGMNANSQLFNEADNGYPMMRLSWQDKIFEFGDLGANGLGTKIVLDDNTTFMSFTSSGGFYSLSNIQEWTDNADAILNGLVAGQIYRTGDNLKIVH
jgi:hypothetical protein